MQDQKENQSPNQPQPATTQPGTTVNQAPTTPSSQAAPTQPPPTAQPQAIQEQQTPETQPTSEQKSTTPQPLTQQQTTASVQETQTAQSSTVIYASFLKRLIALLLDGIIIAAINFPVQIMFGLPNAAIEGGLINGGQVTAAAGTFNSLIGSAIGAAVGMVINLCYFVGFLTIKGATPGKMILGLVVVNTEQGKLTLTKALMREIIGKIASGLVLGLGYLWVIWDEKKQGWHDKIAGTLVVEKKSLPQQ